MCLGEVIIGDVIEALEMLFGRQMVPVNPRGPSLSRKWSHPPRGTADVWNPMFVCVHVHALRWLWLPVWTQHHYEESQDSLK